MKVIRFLGKSFTGLFLILVVLSISTTAWAATYYVRPISGEYGLEDGSDYDNAFDGFADIAWGSLGGGDTLFVAGTHSEQLDIGASGTNSTRLQIMSCTIANGASAYDPGIIDSVNLGSASAGALEINDDDYVTINGLTVSNTTGTGTGPNGVRIVSSTGVTIQNCTITTNGPNSNIRISDGSADWILEFSDIIAAQANGIIFDDNAPEGGIIRYNYFQGNGTSTDPSRCVNNSGDTSYFHNIYVGSHATTPTLIYGNVIAEGACGQGIKAKADVSIYNNLIYGNEDIGVMLIANSNKNGQTVNQYVYNNVIYNDEYTDILFYDEGESTETINVYIYNNTIYNTNPASRYIGGIVIGSSGAPEVFTVKNNIIDFDSISNYCFRANSTPDSSTIERNWCNCTALNPYYWAGGARNLTYWQGTLGFDSPVGDKADPLLSNPASDFTLQSTSPCIDVGEDLGDTFTNALSSSALWTRQNPGIVQSSVPTLNQYAHGSGWEVGAYVFYESEKVAPSPPTGLRVME